MTVASAYAWFNGQIVEREMAAPSVASISFHLGTGVFDGMMAYWNDDHYYIHKCREHFERFRTGSARLGLNLLWSADDFIRATEELLGTESAGTQYIRPIAYRKAPELWVTGSEGRPVDVSIFTVRTQRDIDAPVSCELSRVERVSSRAIPGQTKVSGSYVNSLHCRRTAESGGFDDGIMLDREGRICEASAANVFFLKGDAMLTPALNNDVFPGLTRQTILEIAESEGIECSSGDLAPSVIDSADGAFLCSTLMEIRPISRIGDQHLDTASSPIFQKVVKRFREITHQ